MNKTRGFNLITVIIIICLTSIVSGITTGVIVTNGYKSSTGLTYEEMVNDDGLNEFIEVYSSILKEYYEDIDKEEMLDAAMSGMLEYLDQYTTFLTPEEKEALEDRLSGTYRGIGIEIKERTIINVISDTPAEEAGLKAGDIFLEIDGRDVTAYTSSMIAITIRNTTKESVEVKVLRGDEELDFEIKIQTLVDKLVSSSMVENSNIGYMYFTVFTENIGGQVDKAITDLKEQGMEKLILDLRDNTGGFLDGAEDIANLFLESGKVIYSLENKDETVTTYDKTVRKEEMPVVILLNSQSASAAEVLAAALKDSYGATIVGTVSYGKGKVQQTLNLEDGGMAKYTSAKWLRPDGTCIDGIGIKPDYEVELEYTVDEDGNQTVVEDSQLAKAVEVLSAI